MSRHLLPVPVPVHDKANNDDDDSASEADENETSSSPKTSRIFDAEYEDAHVILSAVPGQFNRKSKRVMNHNPVVSTSNNTKTLLLIKNKNINTTKAGAVAVEDAATTMEGRPAPRRCASVPAYNPWQQKSIKKSTATPPPRRSASGLPIRRNASMSHCSVDGDNDNEDDNHNMTQEQRQEAMKLQKKLRAQKGLRGLFRKVKTIVVKGK